MFSVCAGDNGEESLQGQLKLKSGEMDEEKIDGVQRELVRDDTEPPRGECESIVHPENPDGVSLCLVVILWICVRMCVHMVHTRYAYVCTYVCIIGTS